MLKRFSDHLITEKEDSHHLGISPEHLIAHLEKNKEIRSVVDEKADEISHNFHSNLDHFEPSHRKAINHWAGDMSKKGNYQKVNNHLRYEKPIGAEEHYTIKHLDDMLEKHHTPQALHVYRGIHAPLSHHIDNLKIGDIYADKGFVSTSVDPSRAAYFARDHDPEKNGKFMHIEIPKGSHATYMDHPHLTPFSEREVLLPRDANLKYMGVSEYRQPHGGTAHLHHFKYVGKD